MLISVISVTFTVHESHEDLTEQPIRLPSPSRSVDSSSVKPERDRVGRRGWVTECQDMKRIFALAAVVAAMAALAGESKANGWGAFGAPGLQAAQPQQPVGPVGDRYGYNPMLRHLMWWKKDRCSPNDGCGTGNCGMGGAGMMPGGGGMMAFPNPPHWRSPRDWFQN